MAVLSYEQHEKTFISLTRAVSAFEADRTSGTSFWTLGWMNFLRYMRV
jgi:hypothetical protein